MRYEFHPEALDEYQETTLYYAERDPALALRFVEAVEDAIRRILEAPERWRVLEEDVRRCLTHVFPYGVPVHYRTAVHPYCCCDALQSRAGLLEISPRRNSVTSNLCSLTTSREHARISASE